MAGGKRDYYEILGVAKDADDETLKKAYRKLAMQYHPDRNAGDHEAEVKFKEAAEAFEVLRDPQKRARYDRYGHAGLDGMNMPHFGSAESVMDLFGELFGDLFGGGRRGRRGPRAGRDIQMPVEVDLLEACHGVKKTLKIPRAERCAECGGSGAKPGTQPATCRRCGGHGVVIQGQGFFRIQQTCPGCSGRGSVIPDPCRACHGAGLVEVERSLEVTIPAGMDNDMTLRVPGEGEAGEAGAPAGDLYCILRVRPHPLFVRNGLDLHCEVPVTFSQAALGSAIEVPTLEGQFITRNLQRGTQGGDEMRVRGKGMPGLYRDGRPSGHVGDLIVHVRVVTPRNLTKRQEELLRELADLDGGNVSPERKSFLDKIRAFFTPESPSPDKKPAPSNVEK
jgi:molecular chaperone DnaJ